VNITYRQGRRIELAPVAPAQGEELFELARRELVRVPVRVVPDALLVLITDDKFTPAESLKILRQEQACRADRLECEFSREILALATFELVEVSVFWSDRIKNFVLKALNAEAKNQVPAKARRRRK
jgi:hypothetical protein